LFENITESLGNALRRLTGRGRLTESNIEEGLRDVRKALLEADVHFKVVKDFVERVKAQAVGQELIRSINPGQQIVKIVHDELVALMGKADSSIKRSPKAGSGEPTVIMMVGLQGSGKTTSCGKLAKFLIDRGQRPMLVAADVQRPAAIDQLKVLGEQLKVPVYFEAPGWFKGKPVSICRNAVKQAEKDGRDFVILDTAGRLHIDQELMAELREIRGKVEPHNILLVCDAMTGQDAVNSAKEFNDQLPLDGVILTKLDGDARGGAALSIRAITGKPIKFTGVGEKLDKLEEFHPDRMASRILGMGDVVTLVEKAKAAIDEDKARDMAGKLLGGDTFSLQDFLEHLQSVKKMGPLKDILSMIPGLGSAMKGMDFDDKEITRIEAMIQSMTKEERRNPDIINPSRRQRIARGSGHTPNDVGGLLKQFRQTQQLFKGLGKQSGLRSLFGGGLAKAKKEMEEKLKSGELKTKKRKKPF